MFPSSSSSSLHDNSYDESLLVDEEKEEESLNAILDDPTRWLTGESESFAPSSENIRLRKELSEARTEIEDMMREKQEKDAMLRKDMNALKNHIRHTRTLTGKIEFEAETKTQRLQLQDKYDTVYLELQEARQQEGSKIASLREECEILQLQREEACQLLRSELQLEERECERLIKLQNQASEHYSLEIQREERECQHLSKLQHQVSQDLQREERECERLIKRQHQTSQMILEAEKDHLRTSKQLEEKSKIMLHQQQCKNALRVVMGSFRSRQRCAMLCRGFVTWSVSMNVASSTHLAHEKKMEKLKEEHHIEIQMGKHREVLALSRAEREMKESSRISLETFEESETQYELNLKTYQDEITTSQQRLQEYETMCTKLQHHSQNTKRSYDIERARLEADLEIAKQDFHEQKHVILAEQERASRKLQHEYENSTKHQILSMTQDRDEYVQRLEIESTKVTSELEENLRSESRDVLRIKHKLEIERARFESVENAMRHKMEIADQDAKRMQEDLRDERDRASEWRSKLVHCSETASQDAASWSRKLEDERLLSEMERAKLKGNLTELKQSIESMRGNVRTYHEESQVLRARIVKYEADEASIARDRDKVYAECANHGETSLKHLKHAEELEERVRSQRDELSESKSRIEHVQQEYESKLLNISKLVSEHEIFEKRKQHELIKRDRSIEMLRAEIQASRDETQRQLHLARLSNDSLRETRLELEQTQLLECKERDTLCVTREELERTVSELRQNEMKIANMKVSFNEESREIRDLMMDIQDNEEADDDDDDVSISTLSQAVCHMFDRLHEYTHSLTQLTGTRHSLQTKTRTGSCSSSRQTNSSSSKRGRSSR